jgi:hypothetical protein
MNRKEIDKIISALILICFCIIWIVRLACSDNISPEANNVISIAMKVMLILTYFVLLYNAWGAFDSVIFKIIFLVIALFLILCVVAGWVPAIKDFLKLPTIGF